jgi:pimeloyl-ACP methyl ester carboxylesterase
MTSQHELGWFWAWVHAVRLGRGGALKKVGTLIQLRNVLHVTVSADRRYGSVYNYSVAEMILQGLVRHGYARGSGAPVILLGYSGGGQIALATAQYVRATLRAPVQVISLGGIMNSSGSLATISGLTHFYGTGDDAQRRADWLFPARWPLFSGSQWNQALAEGRIKRVCLGPMTHAGRGSYLDATARLADGRSYRDVTADAIGVVINQLR